MQSTQLGRMLAVVARALVLLMLVELPPADSAASIEATPHHMDSFDDWETYQNESYGYSVRYPQHWTRIEYAPYYTRFVEGPYQIGNGMFQ